MKQLLHTLTYGLSPRRSGEQLDARRPAPARRPTRHRVAATALVVAAFLTVSACTSPGNPPGGSAAKGVPGAAAGSQPRSTTADTIMIIRHGEKPAGKGAPRGIDSQGAPSDGSLTVPGWQRAGALAQLFDPLQPEPLRAGLVRPTAVYAAMPDGADGQRPGQTVAPLSARLGVTTVTTYGKGEEPALARDLVARHGAILVCWQHEKIPAIVKGLGTVHPPVPGAWPGDRYDMIWVFTRDGTGWRFTQVPQLLLAGDTPDPIR